VLKYLKRHDAVWVKYLIAKKKKFTAQYFHKFHELNSIREKKSMKIFRYGALNYNRDVVSGQ